MLFFQTATAYQRSAALKTAIDVGLFTAIGEGANATPDVAKRCGAPERGIRILCDYLTVLGFLTKSAGKYSLTPDSALFLDRRSPAYVGIAVDFLNSEQMTDAFNNLTTTVRTGAPANSREGTLLVENPVWVKFARAMAPLAAHAARTLAEMVPPPSRGQSFSVLDIAAGHGLYGLSFAQRYPDARVAGLDWSNVLDVARENAAAAGVADRWRAIPGSAFDVDWDGPHDLILFPNFLHHFDRAGCETLLRKARAALAQDGRVVTLEFVPNDDRVTPPDAAAFAIAMLGSTPAGEAYTFAEYQKMFQAAGFTRNELLPQPIVMSRVIVSQM